MIKRNFYAVILAGGSGERFWPLSTSERPKQFLKLFGGKSLLRQAAERLHGITTPERVIVITSSRLAAATRRELPELPRENVVAEPCRRDTAAAIAVACGIVRRRGGDNAVGAILTADQLMKKPAVFRRMLLDAVKAASETDSIVTLGVKPDYPSTGFGYIEPAEKAAVKTATEIRRVKRFAEKPDAATAARYIRRGYVWNAGMFVWKASTLHKAFADHAPEFVGIADAVAAARNPAPLIRRIYPGITRISFDFAVMEKASNVLVAMGDFGWDDVGSWTAVERHFHADASSNFVIGKAVAIDSSRSVFVADGADIAVLGLSDIVVVTTGRHVLVADKGRVQELKKLVGAVEASDAQNPKK